MQPPAPTPQDIRAIASKHLDAWFADGPWTPHSKLPTLEDRVVDAIKEALNDPADSPLYIPLELHWKQVGELSKQLADMTQARDDAVAAARMISYDNKN